MTAAKLYPPLLGSHLFCFSGKLTQRKDLLNFIRDLVHSLKLRDGARGTHSKNMRWHESTKRIFDVIRKLGGPKTLRFINETLESPHERTVVRHWQQNKIDYTLGPDDVGWTRTWKEVAAIYEKMKADLTIQGPVLYELSEDETTVPTASQYNERRD